MKGGTVYKVTKACAVLVAILFGWSILEIVHGAIIKRSRRAFQRKLKALLGRRIIGDS